MEYYDTNTLKQTTCKVCGRKLKSKESIELGMGKICFLKYKKQKTLKKLF